MKVELNINDFLTEEHKKTIQDKISKAIENVNVDDLTKEIEKSIIESDISENVVDSIRYDLSIDEIVKPLSKSITTHLKNKLK